MNLKSYSIVTLSYWVFMLTDGALRMLVLLHFHALGFTPVELAFLFLLYEFAGIVTNLIGGWIGSRFGLKITLYSGLALQIIALTALTLFQPSWAVSLSVAFVMLVQCLAGIAKDLTKMSSKSAVKLLVTDDSQSKLFKWVAILTGSKNAIKGIGFFLGGFLLSTLGFNHALHTLTALLGVTLILALTFVRGDFGKMKTKVKFRHLFSKSAAINRLSFARAFLFASRDVWFVVALPIYLNEALGWDFSTIGAVMAAWVIGYGIVQASSPKILNSKCATLGCNVAKLRLWAFALVATCALLFAIIYFSLPPLYLLIGLGIFGFIFALNSSIHSYLILAYTESDDVSINVGFYYMANACGRLLGTLLSGASYLLGGLPACLITTTILALTAAIINLRLPQQTKPNPTT